MSATANRQVRLAARPTGLPGPECWEVTEEPVPEPGPGEFVARLSHLSLDPAMRGWMNAARSYIAPVGIGDVMRAGAVGEVVASRHDDFPEGTHVVGLFGVQEHALSDGTDVHAVDLSVAPAERHLGALGMTGMTAYFALLETGELKGDGETVVVSGAAGAVGGVAGQIAKLKGARVVGIAGGEEKCRHLVDELGFDAAIDYKGEDVNARLRETCPDGIDVYFDNVGGEILDACLARLAIGARVVICGAISQYNAEGGAPEGPRNYLSLLVHRATMRGMVVFDYADRYADAAREMAGWIADGRLVAEEDVVDGAVTDFPDVLLRLFRGENRGKLVLRIG